MPGPLVISILSIVMAGLSLFAASKTSKTANFLLSYLTAPILYGVFMDFGIQYVNNTTQGGVPIAGLALLIGGSVYFACALHERMRSNNVKL